MRKLLLLACFSCTLMDLSAQIVRTSQASVYTRMSTYSALHQDVFSFTGNQAALANTKIFTAGFLGERRFMLQELSSYKLVAVLPTGSGNFGLNTSYSGNPSYNESIIGLAYGRRLSEKVDIGAQFNYNSFHIAGYGSDNAINFDAGLIFHLSSQLHTGVHVYNPTSAKFGKNNDERISAVYSVGLGYDVSDKTFITGVFEKTEDRPVSINAGLHYRFDERIFARAGISSATETYYMGLGVFVSEFRFDFTANLHPHLGLTPGLVLIYTRR